jgi:hypothetical protein
MTAKLLQVLKPLLRLLTEGLAARGAFRGSDAFGSRRNGD